MPWRLENASRAARPGGKERGMPWPALAETTKRRLPLRARLAQRQYGDAQLGLRKGRGWGKWGSLPGCNRLVPALLCRARTHFPTR